jgi:hypothetical protein
MGPLFGATPTSQRLEIGLISSVGNRILFIGLISDDQDCRVFIPQTPIRFLYGLI